MPVTTFSSREFNHDASRAKRAAANGPVFITDRGKLAHVLLSAEDYRRLSRQNDDRGAGSLIERLSRFGGQDDGPDAPGVDAPEIDLTLRDAGL